jgi:methyl-accepting chemotaxis protein
MKINMPVTNNEMVFDDSQFMLTKTDLKGVITYANHDFIKVSGFSESELVGSSHNIVRHPDMPAKAFEDMWLNLKVGRPWSGMVKNRCKNGDYYWVIANATPILESGQVTGYLSARRKPTRQQIDEAAVAYRLFKEGKAQHLMIREGRVVSSSLWSRVKYKLLNFKVSQRMTALIGLAAIVMMVQAGIGIYELDRANQRIHSIYIDRMVPVEDLSRISSLMLENRTNIRIALSETSIQSTKDSAVLVMDPQAATKAAETIEKNIGTITELWKKYLATEITPEERKLAEKFAETRAAFVKEALKPAVVSLRANDYEQTRIHSLKAKELYDAAGPSVTALIKYQSDVAEAEYATSVAQYKTTSALTIAGLISAIGLLAWFGFLIMRSISKPLSVVLRVFDDIKSYKLDTQFETSGNNELGRVLRALKATQTMLSVNTNEAKELAEKVAEQSAQYEGQLAAISQSTGVIEFDMAGKVIAANDIYLKVLGFSRNEVLGQDHGEYVETAHRASDDYKQMWEKLNRGEAVTGEFKRIGKNGKELWLQGSYNPILCVLGKPYKVVLYATDVTEQKLRNADFEGQIDAIGKSQGVIELDLSGTVLRANETYLKMLGYTANELVGKHVSIVLDPTFAKSEAYSKLWSSLAAGGSDAGQYKRIAKNGKEVWIQASYNPIYDLNGKPYKIVNYTIDITEQKLQAADNAGQISAINKIQGVVEFDLTGKILSVNENFASLTGYSEKEITGNHHGMFVEPAYRNSHEYKAFWDTLANGDAQIGQYKRIGKGGKEIWLQASYNPIFDMNGKPFKVVKYATDITEQYNNAATLAAAVEETQHIIENAKTGDLSSRVPLEGKTGAIASLCDGVNALMDKMTEVIIQVKEAGETINTAAGEISSGNTDLSSRTEQQASALEETASSMEELASTVKQNAENAKQANQLATAASGVAIRGGEVVGQVVNTMSAINSSAKKIEDIISVIDGIAFQTNILALNAAVEAARAGEQGRGFAVVAGEVRNLAQRSASAAKEIKELITDSVNKTAEGTKQVENAGQTMQEIVTSVQRVTDIMGEIAAASVEQSSGIDQVNTAITSMDEVTQQNAALVEQAAAAAESLVDQAVGLMDTVSAFKLSRGSAYASTSVRDLRTIASPAQLKGPKPKARDRASASKSLANQLKLQKAVSDSDWEEF